MEQGLTFVCISDSHGFNIPLPPGDVLIHCGDITKRGLKDEVLQFIDWLKKQKFKYKVVIAGNHDLSLDVVNYEQHLKQRLFGVARINSQELLTELKANCLYLENSSIDIEGYKIWGSPQSLEFCNWGFALKKEDSKIFWSQIEENSDIVITHGPPLNHGDLVNNYGFQGHVGDEELLKRILEIKPKYHLFGHIHEGYGESEQDGIKFMNCSILTVKYQVKNQPYVFKLPKKQ